METPPPATSSPTASPEELDQATPFQLRKRPLAERLILAGGIAPEVLIVSREEYNAVLQDLQRLNDSGDCGRMVEDIVAKMEKWNP